MLILLPPSEGKAGSEAGRPFDIGELSLPSLNPSRERVLKALVKLCGGREARAREVLGLSERQTEELDRNRDLLGANAVPASELYTGVLYSALDYPSLTTTARRRVDDWVLVSSALWGAVRLDDRIPSYRLSGDVTLPRLGPVASFWRSPLNTAMQGAAQDHVVVDLRSGVYAKMWAPPPELAGQTVVGRVLLARPDGSRAVVSHHNKATKGRLVRDLAIARANPRSVDEVATAIERTGCVTELHEGRPGKPWTLDIVVDEV